MEIGRCVLGSRWSGYVHVDGCAISSMSGLFSPPDAPADRVPRRRLVDRMLGASTGVVLVVAPAGWGKTTAVAEAAATFRRNGGRVIWSSIGRYDEPAVLWRNLLEAVRVGMPELADDLAPVVVPTSAGGILGLVDRLAGALGRSGSRVLIVIDDVHHVRDPAVLHGLERLVDLRPTGTRIALTARHDPLLPVQRWRMNETVTDVRAAELAATDVEARELLGDLSEQVSSASLRLLLSRMDGWVGGLRLAARSITASSERASAIRDIEQFPGSGDLAAYLIEQVVAELPTGHQRFLEDVSILDPIQVDLARVLTGRLDAVAVLRDLAASTGFLSATTAQESEFRCHALLAAALSHRLMTADRARAARLHRAAAQWYVDQQQPVAAARHAVDASDWVLAREILMTDIALITVQGQIPDLLSLLRRVPRTVLLGDVQLAALGLGAAGWSGDFSRWDELLPVLDRGVGVLPEAWRGRARWIAYVRAMTLAGRCRVLGDFHTMVAALQQVDAADFESTSSMPGATRWDAVHASNAGVAELWAGDRDVAGTLFARVAATIQTMGGSLPALNCSAHLSVLDLLDGRLVAADGQARRALADADRRGWSTTYQAAPAYATLATVALERGELDAADDALARAELASRGWSELAISVLVHVARARVATARGRADEAVADLRSLRLDPRNRPTTPALESIVAFAEAEARSALGDVDGAFRAVDSKAPGDPVLTLFAGRRALLRGDPPEAVRILSEPRARPGPGRLRAVEVRRLLWLGRAQQLAGQRTRALASLGAALDSAALDGYRFPFHEVGLNAAALLDLPLPSERGSSATLLEQLRRDLPHPGRTSARSTSVGEVKLTARERDILVLLPTRMNREEMSQLLHLSSNTVKTHLQSLYRKLDADSRNAAIRAAEDHGLL